jgi:hypothetical protein
MDRNGSLANRRPLGSDRLMSARQDHDLVLVSGRSSVRDTAVVRVHELH